MSGSTNETNSEFLFTITGVFQIKGRRTVRTVVAGLVDNPIWNRLQAGDIVEVRDGEMVVLRTAVAEVAMFMVDPPPTTGRWPVGVVISKEAMPQVVEGQTLWRVASHSSEDG